jgi:leader peptidase (prepilin peptidase)/N-methyltransferase
VPDIQSRAVLEVVFAFAFGANVGSFLNVVAHRVPLGLSVVRPRSRCPACRTPVRAADNVPILSWVLLGGRCRGCKGRISPRYAVVELLTGAVAAYVVAAVAWPVQPLVATPGVPGSAAYLVEWGGYAHAGIAFAVAAAMLAASLVDLDHRILPDAITIPGMWAGPAACALLPRLMTDPPSYVPSAWPLPGDLPLPLVAAAISVKGIAAGAGTVWLLGWLGSRAFGKEAMGFGDVKFLGMIGGFVGAEGAVLALVVAAFSGSIAGFVRVLLTRDRYIPFGPFLALGGLVALVHGHDVVGWYLGTLGVR